MTAVRDYAATVSIAAMWSNEQLTAQVRSGTLKRELQWLEFTL
jgi:hypothetical protein